jgi:hypothetical protein
MANSSDHRVSNTTSSCNRKEFNLQLVISVELLKMFPTWQIIARNINQIQLPLVFVGLFSETNTSWGKILKNCPPSLPGTL